MADFPTVIDYPLPVTSTLTANSIGIGLAAMSKASMSTAVWPSANLAFYIPFRVGYPVITQNMFWLNGASVGNNTVQVGIYDSQQNQLVISSATTTSGINSPQKVSISITLEPGLYYMAIVMNGTTDQSERSALVLATAARSLGIYTQASAAPLPSPAVFAITAQTYVPFVGITTQSVV